MFYFIYISPGRSESELESESESLRPKRNCIHFVWNWIMRQVSSKGHSQRVVLRV